MKLTICCLLLLLCSREGYLKADVSRYKWAHHVSLAAVPGAKSVSLRLHKIEGAPAYEARFRFKNSGKNDVEILGSSPPVKGVFRPRFVRYEAFVGGRWVEVPVFYDGVARGIRFTPGFDCIFVIPLWPYAKLDQPVLGRIKLEHGIYSDEFVFERGSPKRSQSL